MTLPFDQFLDYLLSDGSRFPGPPPVLTHGRVLEGTDTEDETRLSGQYPGGCLLFPITFLPVNDVEQRLYGAIATPIVSSVPQCTAPRVPLPLPFASEANLPPDTTARF